MNLVKEGTLYLKENYINHPAKDLLIQRAKNAIAEFQQNGWYSNHFGEEVVIKIKKTKYCFEYENPFWAVAQTRQIVWRKLSGKPNADASRDEIFRERVVYYDSEWKICDFDTDWESLTGFSYPLIKYYNEDMPLAEYLELCIENYDGATFFKGRKPNLPPGYSLTEGFDGWWIVKKSNIK